MPLLEGFIVAIGVKTAQWVMPSMLREFVGVQQQMAALK